MGWPEVVLATVAAFQVVALTWIAAWQQRAAREVRKLNGTVETQLRAIAQTAMPRSSAGFRSAGDT